jgi:cullin-associated NEDD8-dissociated protein 1
VTVKVIADVVEHSVVPGGPWVDAVIAELSTYLRRNNREVKASSLKALFDIVPKFSTEISQLRVDNLVDNLSAVLVSDDSQLYPSALDVITFVVHNCNLAAQQVDTTLSPAIVGLFEKQAVQTQGTAWSSYGTCLSALSQKGLSEAIYNGLLQEKELDGNSLAANAKAMATLLTSSPPPHSEWQQWKSSPVDASLENRLLRLMVIGEGGKLMYVFRDFTDTRDLSQWISLDELVTEMNNRDEKIRSAAAFALGGVVAGNVQKYFPALLEYLQRTTQAIERSLILHSIKEVSLSYILVNDRSSLSTLMFLERRY